MIASTQKNRRYRNAKISEHRLRRVVDCFARNMTAKASAEATKLSQPTIEGIFHRLREKLRDHGRTQFNFAPGTNHPARHIFNKTYRGTPEELQELFAIETITRILFAQNFRGFERLDASVPANVEKARRLIAYNNSHKAVRYRVWEELNEAPLETGAKPTRPFNPHSFRTDSAILINEVHASPEDAFFAWLWKMLLHHPL